jgi:SAM-dependent methyltransferase
MKCIACQKDWKPVDSWEVKSIFGEEKFNIEFCECDLGKTIINTEIALQEANASMYDNVQDRVKIYFKNQHNHTYIRYIQSLNEIKKITSGTKLLEVGSNIGFTLNLAKDNGFDVTGCEINKNCVACSNLLFGNRVLEDFFLIEEKFDIIIMNDVLEHFPHPEDAIIQAGKLLNPTGVLFIQLPNIRSKKARKLKKDWQYLAVPDHTFHFSINSLELLLKNNNFRLEWKRTCTSIGDMSIFNLFPKKIRPKVVALINTNPFYFPRLYTRKKGELIQTIFVTN